MNYAGFWRRLAAYFIDSLILTLPSLVLGGSVLSISGAFGAGLLLGFLYYPFFESSSLSGTPGKALMKMVVLSEAGERLAFKAAVVRYLCRYLSVLTCYIGYFMQVFTSKRQALHDMLSESVVVNRDSGDINYFVVWRDQFKDVVNKL